jgi:hypothetical protein
VAPTVGSQPEAAIPSLDESRGYDDPSFRRGRTGNHQDELPNLPHQLFWSQTDNQTAMALLGYPSMDS